MVEVWSISNKTYSRNVMIVSKVFCMTYFITFYEFACTYPLLYTAGMCVVTYIGVYNTYLNGRCFMSALYNDVICATPPQSKLLFVSNISWHSTPVLANCSTRIDFSLEQIIKQIRWGLSMKILWPSPSTLRISCSTVPCVAVIWVVACCRCLPKYTLIS